MLEVFLTALLTPIAAAAVLVYVVVAIITFVITIIHGDSNDHDFYEHVRTRLSLAFIFAACCMGLAWPFVLSRVVSIVTTNRFNYHMADRLQTSRSLWMSKAIEAEADVRRLTAYNRSLRDTNNSLMMTMNAELSDPSGTLWDHHIKLIVEARRLLASQDTPEAKAFLDKTGPYDKKASP